MRRVRRLHWWALAALLAACSPAPAPPAEAPPLRLVMDYWSGYYPAVLAAELGYLDAEGVRLEISTPQDTDRMLAEFAAGEHDLMGTALGDLITFTRVRADVRVLLVADVSDGGDALLARPQLPVDQRPLRVGTNLGGFGELFVADALAGLGIGTDQVQMLDIEGADVPAALARGQIDLGHTWEPYVSAAEAAGAVRRFDSRRTPGLIPDVIATTAAAVRERAPELRAFSRAWFRAQAWWRDNPQQGNAIIERRLGLPAGSVDLRGMQLQDLEANRRAQQGAGAGLLAVIDRHVQFFLDSGALLDAPAAGSLLLPELLPADPPTVAP